jgi:hypothetical protein
LIFEASCKNLPHLASGQRSDENPMIVLAGDLGKVGGIIAIAEALPPSPGCGEISPLVGSVRAQPKLL